MRDVNGGRRSREERSGSRSGQPQVPELPKVWYSLAALLCTWLSAADAYAEAAPEPPLPAVSARSPALVPPAALSGPRSCVACRFDAAELLGNYSVRDLDRLRSGEVLVRPVDAPERDADVGATAWIRRSPSHVWAVLTDFESWPEFVPLVRETHVTRRAGSRLWVLQEYRVVFRTLSHTTIYELHPALGQLRWQLDQESEHDIAESRGRWQFVPVDDGEATLVHYQARMDAGRAVPAFLEDLLVQRSLRDLLVQLREEAVRVPAAPDRLPSDLPSSDSANQP